MHAIGPFLRVGPVDAPVKISHWGVCTALEMAVGMSIRLEYSNKIKGWQCGGVWVDKFSCSGAVQLSPYLLSLQARNVHLYSFENGATKRWQLISKHMEHCLNNLL